jgi:hypothetical protein
MNLTVSATILPASTEPPALDSVLTRQALGSRDEPEGRAFCTTGSAVQWESTIAQTATTPGEAVKAIDGHELKAKIDRNDSFVLLETLSPEHFQHVHLLEHGMRHPIA